MGVKITSKQGKGTVAKKAESGAEVEEQEAVEPVNGHGLENPAMVSFSSGATINLGDYNSAKVNVSLTMPSAPDEDSLNETFEFTKAWVDEHLQAEVDELQGE